MRGLWQFIERRIRRKVLEWLLKDGYLKVGNTIVITSQFIDLEKLISDPTYSSGRLWWREDLKNLFISDGTAPMPVFLPVRAVVPGRYYGSFDAATAFTTLTLTANMLYATPFVVFMRMRFDRIAINVTTAGAAGTRARMGIYRDNGSGYPSSLIPGTDIAEVAVDSTGVKENAIDVTLQPGLYWLALVASGAPAVRAIPVASADSEILGLGSDLGTAPGLGYSVSYTYGALPPTFPSGASVHTSVIPLIALRRAT